jgi:hypothetical protein
VTQTTVIMEQARGDSPVVSTVSPGVMLPLVGQQGDWYLTDVRVGFDTKRGWIHRQTVQLVGPVVPPQLPVPFPVPQPDATQQTPSGPPTGGGAGLGQIPSPFWFNGGIGIGTVGCDTCAGQPTNGWSGGLGFGRAITPRLWLGVGGSGWARSGSEVGVGMIDGRLRFYPSEEKSFFLTAGVGVGVLKAAGVHSTGIGGLVGVGLDIAVRPNLSLTPFLNGFAMTSSTADANVAQIGLGITVH